MRRVQSCFRTPSWAHHWGTQVMCIIWVLLLNLILNLIFISKISVPFQTLCLVLYWDKADCFPNIYLPLHFITPMCLASWISLQLSRTLSIMRSLIGKKKCRKKFLRFLGSRCGLPLDRGDSENYRIRLKHFNTISLQICRHTIGNKLFNNQLESSLRGFRQLETFVLPLRYTNSYKNFLIVRTLGRCNSFRDLVDVISQDHRTIKRCLGNHFKCHTKIETKNPEWTTINGNK